IAYDNMMIEPSKMKLDGIGMYESYHTVSTLYIYSEKISDSLQEALNEIIETFPSILAGVSKVEESLLIVRILGKSVIDIQEAIQEIWNETRIKLLDKKAVRIRKY
ncbi:MAG: hypothetical protein RR131_02000, partial [Anaerovorax sp.]